MADFTTYGFISGYHDLYYTERDTDGTYTVAAGTHLGSTGPEGIRLVRTSEVEEITGDALGNTVVDAIYKGGNCTLEFVLQQIDDSNDVAKAFLSAFRETSAAPTTTPTFNEVGVVGHTAVTFAGTLVAVPRDGTPAATAYGGNPATGTRGNTSRVFMGYPFGEFSEFLDTRHNVIPVSFRALPQDVSGTQVWWRWTSDAP